MYDLAEFLLVCIDVIVMPSAYEISCTGNGGMPDVYMLKSMGEMTVLCSGLFKFEAGLCVVCCL